MLRDLLEGASLIEIFGVFIALGLIAATILSLIYIIVGGILFILSAGNEDKIKRAIHTIRFSIIGLIVSFLGFFFVRFLSNLLDIPFELTFSDIIDLMEAILDAMS
jgi:4-amino-4-deoxy-L-arabinose transferase-like glycosyltransferase